MRIAFTLCLMTLAVALGGCWGQYVNRSDTITLSAGNAKDVNAATHVIDPWPRYVNNRRIRADGERMVGAVGRYHRPQTRSRGQGQAQGAQGANAGDAAGAETPAGGSSAAATPPAALPF